MSKPENIHPLRARFSLSRDGNLVQRPNSFVLHIYQKKPIDPEILSSALQTALSIKSDEVGEIIAHLRAGSALFYMVPTRDLAYTYGRALFQILEEHHCADAFELNVFYAPPRVFLSPRPAPPQKS